MAKNRKRIREKNPYDGLIWTALIAIAVVVVLVAALAQRGEKAKTAYASAQSDIRFSEVMTANVSALKLGEAYPDWIEVTNVGTGEMNLYGWAITRAGDPSEIYCFPSLSLKPGEYYVVYADKGAGDDHAPFRIASSGETLLLLNTSGTTVDSVTTPSLKDDTVYCLDASGEWAVSAEATPGSANRIVEVQDDQRNNRGETAEPAESEAPAAAVSTNAADVDLVITEVMTRNKCTLPDASGECDDYIEIHNITAAPVSLSGWTLSSDSQYPTAWAFPDATIQPDEYLIVRCCGEDRAYDGSGFYANFKLGKESAEAILTRPDGTTASYVKTPALGADQAYSKLGNVWKITMAPTPGMANTAASVSQLDAQTLAANDSGVRISEIAAASNTVGSDWIEITNTTSSAIDLSGWGLSDNSARPRKWQFPEGTTIAPGQYLGVICSGQDAAANGQIHTSFRLSADGGYTITLCKPDGTIVDRTYLPLQYPDMTYGRSDSRQGFSFLATPTPLSANTGVAYAGRAAIPEYSVYGGLYKTGDTLEVSITADPGMRVYYTLDNTDPTESSNLYTQPITITQTTILRTRVYADSYMESYMDTQSYLFDVNNGNGVYVISVVSDPANLTSDEKGIMVKGPNALPDWPYGSMNKGANFWMDWEREAHVEIFSGDGSTVISQGCGIKIAGQYSRAEDQQAFKLIARNEYSGDNRFRAALFTNRDYTAYQSLVLRSSGQDTDKIRMRDSILTSLAKDTSVMYQETEVCVLYLDGQYWGHYNLRERVNSRSICQFEGWEGDEDNVDLIKANSNVMQGSNETFEALLKYVKSADPTTDEFYNTVDSAIDIQNYIEYMAIEIFTGNTDTLNVKRYRNSNADGKWRWILFDLDWAFTVNTNSINRWLTPGGMGNGLRTDNSLFIACMKNPRFRDQFLTHMGKEMATTFSTENILKLAQERYAILQPLLADQFAKWGSSEDAYQTAMNEFVNYAKRRPMLLLGYFKGVDMDNGGKEFSKSQIKLSDEEMQKYFGDAIAKIQQDQQ